MELLVLASASPRRRDILKQIGIHFELFPTQADESLPDGLSAEQAVYELAKRKGLAAAAAHPDRICLAADTLVELDGQLLGKPSDDQQARAMLTRLSGRTHSVLTGVCIVHRGNLSLGVCRTEVTFAPLTEQAIDAYVSRGLSRGKAGAYGIQDVGALFVSRISGDYNNVVGLPVSLLCRLLADAGVSMQEIISGASI